MNIVVTGGKGGTGKSTISILLAKAINAILVDADVECPDDHILIGAKLNFVKSVYQEFPKIIESKCTKCGLCVSTCTRNAIVMIKDQYPRIIEDMCDGCGACWAVCPEKAIETVKKEIGKISDTKVGNFRLVSGISIPGVEEVSPIVDEVKNYANEIRGTKVIDSAAGTHCNVTHAVMNSDLAILVTEPTPLGVHDLKKIIELVNKFKMPYKIVINRYEENEHAKEIENLGETIKIPYDEELVKAYMKNDLLNFDKYDEILRSVIE